MRSLALLLAAACAPTGPTFGLSRADGPANHLVFNNATEPEFLDPTQATGHPDARIIDAIFDGLTEYHPKDLTPVPGLARSWDVHPDGRGYTFHLRDDATWTDGHPVTTEDVIWSWSRVLDPIYAARYAQQLYMVDRAEAFNAGRALVLAADAGPLPAGTAVHADDTNLVRLTRQVTVGDLAVAAGSTVQRLADGDPVRLAVRPGCPDLAALADVLDCPADTVEGEVPAEAVAPSFLLAHQRVATRTAAITGDDGAERGTLARGDEVALLRVEGQRAKIFRMLDETTGWTDADAVTDPLADVVTYTVSAFDPIDWDGATAPAATDDAGEAPPASAEASRADVRFDPAALGVRARDAHTLDVRLRGVAPYFLTLTGHTTLRPANRRAWEAHGSRWTRPEHIVTNGPFMLVEHVVRDKFVLEKNPEHWAADTVALDAVTAFSIDNMHTSANLYRAGYTDLVVANDIPVEFIPILEDKQDYEVGPALSVYFYRLNVDREPLDDRRVRQALTMAIDRSDVVQVMKAGQLPATHIVPPGLPDYGDGVPGYGFDPERARELLAEAGFPGGEGFPELSILYNTLESHKLIAAVIQDQWKRHLGITVQLENREWKTYLKAMHAKDYDIARSGWIGDYVDPLTFLELWITGGGNNETGWSNERFDELILQSSQVPDEDQRLAMLREAEGILNEELPILPIYHYVWYSLTQPTVQGVHPNVLDKHPLRFLSLDR